MEEAKPRFLSRAVLSCSQDSGPPVVLGDTPGLIAFASESFGNNLSPLSYAKNSLSQFGDKRLNAWAKWAVVGRETRRTFRLPQRKRRRFLGPVTRHLWAHSPVRAAAQAEALARAVANASARRPLPSYSVPSSALRQTRVVSKPSTAGGHPDRVLWNLLVF